MSTAAKTLVVVESPAKAKTIKKYLGSAYEVMASKGHIKDLPKKMGVDVEKDFTETYEVIEGKAKVLAELKGAAKNASAILLATDPDREGEAIAWHVMEELKRPKLPIHRVEFHEITKKGVEHGVAHPRKLDDNLYDAQRARRVLDRIVGYDVSALVWSKLAFGLSAGRVQSVALRLIVDREREIEAFVPEEYWNVGVALVGQKRPSLVARLVSADGEKFEVKNDATATVVRGGLESAQYVVEKITRREQRRKAPAPYSTSKLQQDGTSYLRFTTKRTMQIAQGLYEGVDLGKDGGPVGLITYMRTDSLRVSEDAIQSLREHIAGKYGADHLPEKPNYYKAKKNAQEAHEAIRPTSLEFPPDSIRKHLKDEQYKLYKLIWERFVASQMAPAVYDQTSVDIDATVGAAGKSKKSADGVPGHAKYGLRATGRVLKFGGWLEAYGKGVLDARLAGEEDETSADANGAGPGGETGEAAGPNGSVNGNANGPPPPENVSLEELEEASLPELTEGEKLTMVNPPGVVTEQKFTQPAPRYNEGSLVRELEKRGIGRPSTYAEIIGKVQARDYVEKIPSGGFKPTLLGKFVVDGLVGSSLDFMDPNFTAKMEEDLDEVEAGRLGRVALLKRFYKRFREQLDVSKKQKRWTPEPEETDQLCPDCSSKMLKRWSKNGWFLGCSAYPKCKVTQDLGPDGTGTTPLPIRLTDYKCDKCGKPMMIKTGRYGEFLSCTGYPGCKNAKPVPLGIPCPKCGGDIIEIKSRRRGGRSFYGCSNYSADIKCDFKLWQKPINEPCPSCGAKFLVFGGGKKAPVLACQTEGCGFKKPIEEAAPGPGPAAGAHPALHDSAAPPAS
ncbi:MAG TPA: type I DNA topoisomerase [Polyangiaceae bacterium]|nr:type I DNA topoisomerase [Polyangiaceae bacterium]